MLAKDKTESWVRILHRKAQGHLRSNSEELNIEILYGDAGPQREWGGTPIRPKKTLQLLTEGAREENGVSRAAGSRHSCGQVRESTLLKEQSVREETFQREMWNSCRSKVTGKAEGRKWGNLRLQRLGMPRSLCEAFLLCVGCYQLQSPWLGRGLCWGPVFPPPGREARETVKIINKEEQGFNFAFQDNSRFSEGFNNSLIVCPMEGWIPPLSR